MNEFWFYLEPYTFVWVKSDNVLLYNTLSGNILLYKGLKKISDLFLNLLQPENMYCVKLSEQDYNDLEINAVVNEVRDSFSGDIISVSKAREKPLIFPPILNFQKDIKRIEDTTKTIKEQDIVLSYGNDVLSNLFELTFYINGECLMACSCCTERHKQMRYCTKSSASLSVQDIKKFLEYVTNKTLRINLLGGNIFLHPSFDDIFSLLNRYKAIKTYFIFYRNVNPKISEILSISGNRVKLLLEAFPDINVFSKIVNDFGTYNNLAYLFSVASESEYRNVQNLVAKYELPVDNVEIRLFYNGNNLKFFEENVFVDEDDFKNVKLSRRQIFMRQEVNSNNFGSLIVDSDGTVRANNSSSVLGTIKDDLRVMIYKEMTEGDSWMKIRNQSPCCNCVFQYLCPSPSEYEMALDKANLCHVSL